MGPQNQPGRGDDGIIPAAGRGRAFYQIQWAVLPRYRRAAVRRLHPISAKGGGYMSVEIKGLDSCVGNCNRWAVSWSRRRKKAWRRPRRPCRRPQSCSARLTLVICARASRRALRGSLGRIRRHGRYDCGIRPVCRIRHRADGAASPSPPKAPLSLGYREDWKGQFAQPYLYPSLIDNRDRIVKHLEIELRKGIREAMK